MKHNHPILYKLSEIINGSISKSSMMTKAYLITWGALLRATPNFPFKQNVTINIRGYSWPHVKFNAVNVRLSGECEIKLVPNIGEFDFNALFSKELGYETELFELLTNRIRQYEAIIEIGANVGVYTAFFSVLLNKLNLSTPIFAFEPSRKAFTRLLSNLAANNAKNVFPFNLAVSNECKFLRFYEPDDHLTNGSLSVEFASIFSENVAETIVPAFAADQLAGLIYGYKKLLIKIDVEGAEEIVLNGLAPLIEDKQPDIILEVLKPHDEQLNKIDILRENYEFYLITHNGIEHRAILEAHPNHRDYLLVPRGRSTREANDK